MTHANNNRKKMPTRWHTPFAWKRSYMAVLWCVYIAHTHTISYCKNARAARSNTLRVKSNKANSGMFGSISDILAPIVKWTETVDSLPHCETGCLTGVQCARVSVPISIVARLLLSLCAVLFWCQLICLTIVYEVWVIAEWLLKVVIGINSREENDKTKYLSNSLFEENIFRTFLEFFVSEFWAAQLIENKNSILLFYHLGKKRNQSSLLCNGRGTGWGHWPLWTSRWFRRAE